MQLPARVALIFGFWTLPPRCYQACDNRRHRPGKDDRALFDAAPMQHGLACRQRGPLPAGAKFGTRGSSSFQWARNSLGVMRWLSARFGTPALRARTMSRVQAGQCQDLDTGKEPDFNPKPSW